MAALSWMVGVVGTVLVSTTGPGAIAWAQTDDVTEAAPTAAEALMQKLQDVPSIYELGLDYLSDQDSAWPTITQADTSPVQMTLPSLWWSRDQLPNRWSSFTSGQRFIQLDGYRLIRGWNAFHSLSGESYIIDLQVDPQYWNRLEYAQKYAILNQFGTIAMGYGYQVRIFSSISLVGLHTCDFSRVPALASYPSTEVPVPELNNVQCAAGIGPFIQIDETFIDEDLFAPP
ncbi:MAG: hypothetical protein F6J95_004465 [Leptolyngbya sp. SIO1E4]|nr:hypothetical protein [Leptolyngbya sp. SIO1E4]